MSTTISYEVKDSGDGPPAKPPPWVCTQDGCTEARPAKERKPARCPRCGYPMERGGPRDVVARRPPNG